MLSKGQKVYMYISAILSMLIGIVVFVPFRTLPFLCNMENVETIMKAEMLIKFAILPVVIIALSIYANVKKYRDIQECLDRSKVVNVMSYFPIVSYLCAILVFVIHTLAYSCEPLGFGPWAVIMVLLILYLAFLVVGFHCFSNLLFKLNITTTIILDCVILAVTACFVIVAWRVDVNYLDVFKAEEAFVGHGDPVLFFLYIITVISFIVICARLARIFKKDNRSIYVCDEAFERDYDRIVKREYNRAYNDIMDDFEIYFKHHFEDEFDPKGKKPETENENEETLDEEQAPAHCANCGAELIPGNDFCTNCGTKVETPVEEQTETEESEENTESTETVEE